MLCRWKKALLQVLITCGFILKVLSTHTPRFLIGSIEGCTSASPILNVLILTFRSWALVPIKATFHTRTAQLATYLLKRGYNCNFVNKQIQRAADIPRHLTLQTKDINKPKRIPFITTFNPSLPHISHIIEKHFNLLLSSNRCKSVFQHLPVVAFRRSPNLRDLLVTAKLPSNSANPQLPCGSFRCGKNCATCPYISHGLTT